MEQIDIIWSLCDTRGKDKTSYMEYFFQRCIHTLCSSKTSVKRKTKKCYRTVSDERKQRRRDIRCDTRACVEGKGDCGRDLTEQSAELERELCNPYMTTSRLKSWFWRLYSGCVREYPRSQEMHRELFQGKGRVGCSKSGIWDVCVWGVKRQWHSDGCESRWRRCGSFLVLPLTCSASLQWKGLFIVLEELAWEWLVGGCVIGGPQCPWTSQQWRVELLLLGSPPVSAFSGLFPLRLDHSEDTFLPSARLGAQELCGQEEPAWDGLCGSVRAAGWQARPRGAGTAQLRDLWASLLGFPVIC